MKIGKPHFVGLLEIFHCFNVFSQQLHLGKRIRAVHMKNFTRENAGGTLAGFGDNMLEGDIDWKAVNRALKQVGYRGFCVVEMIPFCRLPNLVLPDMKLARSCAKAMRKIEKM